MTITSRSISNTNICTTHQNRKQLPPLVRLRDHTVDRLAKEALAVEKCHHDGHERGPAHRRTYPRHAIDSHVAVDGGTMWPCSAECCTDRPGVGDSCTSKRMTRSATSSVAVK